MGSITSRGDNWPPKPYKRLVVRDQLNADGTIEIVEDYVWVRPGCELPNGCGGTPADWREETSPSQENGIRNLEDG